MSFVNTVDIIGDEALTNSILNGSITEIADNRVTSVGDSAFRGCSALFRADFPSVTGIYNTAFYDCSSLVTLALRSETMCTLYYTGSFDGSPIVNGTGFIYVPAALYDSYLADSKWSTFANQFRKLEDYTVDGTLTGEVDPTRCRVRFFNDDGTLLGYVMVPNGGTATYDGDDPVCSEDASWPFEGFAPEPTNVTADMDCYAQYQEPITLETASWAKISEISAAGTGANYFAVGDTKSIVFDGFIDVTKFDKQTKYVFILGFDHNSEIEGKGISFGCFKHNRGDYLVSTNIGYNTVKEDGTKTANMNHWGKSNRGGWAACDLRYDILGSTDVAPNDYGSKKSASSVGYDASDTCATNPAFGTFMNCLPAELRAVMKPITKWTNNNGGSQEDAAVTATIDYLPLMSAIEVKGAAYKGNEYEKNYQKQYDYFASGGSAISDREVIGGSPRVWWTRTPVTGYITEFNQITDTGQALYCSASSSNGLIPVFLV